MEHHCLALLVFCSIVVFANARNVKRDLNPYVIGGTDTNIAALPHMGFLLYFENSGAVYLCSCFLITPKHFLTAGHCAFEDLLQQNGYFTAVFGASDFVDNTPLLDRGYPTQERKVSRLLTRPNWKVLGEPGRFLVADICIMELEQEIDVTAYVKPIELGDKKMEQDAKDNPNCYISGYGLSNLDPVQLPANLQSAQVNIAPNQECRKNSTVNTALPAHFLCIPTRPSICSGDSGSPLVCKDEDDIFKVVGIASFGLSSCSGFSVFERTSFSKQWLTKTQQNWEK